MENRLAFVGLGCLVAGAIVWGVFSYSRGPQVDLTGSILKVRTQEGPESTIVVVDFRITNPSKVPFVVNSVAVSLDTGDPAAPVESKIFSKPDIVQVYQYFPQLKPQDHEVLTFQDRIEPGQTLDRMVASSFDVPPSVVDSRKALRLKIEETDGVAIAIIEKK